MKEFFVFLKTYGVIGLAIAVIIGGKLNMLVTALVDGLLMPIVGFLIPGGDWRTAAFDIGRIHFVIGPFLGAALDFLIVAWIIFTLSKRLTRVEVIAAK